LIAFSVLAPERLQIIPSLISSLLIIIMGVVLFTRRLRGYLGGHSHDHHDHDHAHGHDHHDDHDHTHSHGHSHLPPGADGTPVTWRTLLPLGISGGLLPCPSAILVVLAANALGRDLYGLLLVTAFSLGLAGVLTTVGIMFIKAGDWLHLGGRTGNLIRLLPMLPIASAAFISMVGFVMLYQTLNQAGVSAASLWEAQNLPGQPAGAIPIVSILIGGLILGLKHAVEADHLAAVSAIVSERKSILSSSLVGGLWGLGHTISLLIAGLIVIILKVQIPDRVALALEFCVALMLIGLGINALLRIRKGGRLHIHEHEHGGVRHFHPHLHPHEHATEPQTHHRLRIGIRPLLVGMVHGMAGSAALMLLVIPTIPSPGLALVYISIFGLGSIGGMMAMSTLLGLPLQLTAERFKRAHSVVCALAACFSLGFGLFLAYEIGFVEGLLR
jgi:ABC-type nickel/cobalt efflux system permease component RcnA